ncbi:hypothetical protein EMA8858_04085 [Emticicia aquatica]|uniref:Holin-X, holin superfamily III n=1 Tax=Emticicia aquatica TaxID=1681835 RepID=A0ABM9AWQ2_9BACT|nr:hypothetical protein [Emticicia aquatica]CAH0997950.1 hypothetical protein EMA8858_04085 [Emticicia aquatica]
MSNNETSIETLFGKAEDCTKTTLELLKLKAIDKSADIVSSFAMRLAFFIVVALFIIISNIGLALWIGDLLGKSYYGFFIIAAIYGVLAITLRSFLHQWVKVPVSNFIITQMLKSKSI